MRIDDQTIATTSFPLDTISQLLDLTPRRVQQLSAEGVIPRAQRGRYELVPAVQGYIRFLRGHAQAREADPAARARKAEAAEANLRLKAAQERLTRIKADKLASKLIAIEEVEAAWAEVIIAVRQAVLSIPTRMRFGLPHLTAHDPDGADSDLPRRSG